MGNGESYVVYANVTATVMYSGQVTAELVFRDDGTGGQFYLLYYENRYLEDAMKMLGI